MKFEKLVYIIISITLVLFLVTFFLHLDFLILVHLRLDGMQLIARLKPVSNLKVSENLTLYLTKDKVFYFYDKSGNNLNL